MSPFDDDTPTLGRGEELRALSDLHGRPDDWIADALNGQEAILAADAASLGAVDSLATGLTDLLQQADGRGVELASGSATVQTAGATLETSEPGLTDRLWLFLFQPTVAYLLLCLGVLGLFLNLSAPGSTSASTIGSAAAGVIGLLSLVGAVVILGTMPLSWIGLVLIAGGLALLILDIFIRSLGLLTVGGLAAFVVGSYVLFEGDGSAGYVVAPAAIWGVTACLIVLFLFRASSSLKGVRRRPATGRESLVGQVGMARTALAPEGMVFVDGELWRAHALCLHRSAVAPVIAAGAPVVVTRIDGLLLEVRAASTAEVEEAGHPLATDPGTRDRRGEMPVDGRRAVE